MASMDYPVAVKELIAEFKRLPGVGPRSAERIAIWLLQSKKANGAELATALTQAATDVVICEVCGFFATQTGCPCCDAGGREDDLLCVVEQPTDVLPIERSGAFRGKYHCLGGKLSPLDHVTPADLRIVGLLQRVRPGMEVILALGSDVEGEATAHYLAEELRRSGCRLSRIAQGLPAGGGLEHADELTLLRAMQGRRNISVESMTYEEQ
jgi:recombination protein RecR